MKGLKQVDGRTFKDVVIQGEVKGDEEKLGMKECHVRRKKQQYEDKTLVIYGELNEELV